MAKLNVLTPGTPIKTYEGGPARQLTPMQELERTVLACMLWENTFYESGEDAATRIHALVVKMAKDRRPGWAAPVIDLMHKARHEYKLRHAPLWLAVALVHEHVLTADDLYAVIERADELSEFVAMYWKDGKKPLPNQVKLGLAHALTKFDEYQLARYQDGAVKLRDVMFLTHPRPSTPEQAALWKRLADKELATPDTWEVALSGGADKKETFTRLLAEGRLGYMALLRNLRNMREAGVEQSLVQSELMRGAARSRALPFRFVAAAMTNPQWESMIEQAMFEAVKGVAKLPGTTALMVDVSVSMDAALSKRSDLNRMKAATALAMLCREVCEQVEVYSFSNELHAIPDRRGFALGDAIINSQPHGGTPLGAAIEGVRAVSKADRLIVFTDEQASDRVPAPVGRGYMVNVSSEKYSVGYGAWTHVTGFSEAIIEYIRALESAADE